MGIERDMRAPAIALLVCGCGLPPLTAEELYGSLASASLSGLVRDVLTGAGVGGATVHAGGVSATSASNGEYRIDGLTTGPVDGSAIRQGYDKATFQATLRAGVNVRNIDLAPLSANVSGSFADACDGQSLAALARVGPAKTCGTSGKGGFFLQGLPRGVPLAFVVGKNGYLQYTTEVTLRETFTVLPPVRLMRSPDCTAAKPVDFGCTCDDPECVR